jgi:hypothetical protein
MKQRPTFGAHCFSLDIVFRKAMGFRLFAIAVACSLWAAQAFSLTPPEAGITVFKTFKVPLATEIPAECVGWHIKPRDVFIALDKQKLEQLVLKNKNADLRTLLDDTLRTAGRPTGTSGCAEVDFAQLPHARLFFHSALEDGSAVILVGNQSTPAEHVIVNYSGIEGNIGHVNYGIPGQTPFYSRVWWIR